MATFLIGYGNTSLSSTVPAALCVRLARLQAQALGPTMWLCNCSDTSAAKLRADLVRHAEIGDTLVVVAKDSVAGAHKLEA